MNRRLARRAALLATLLAPIGGGARAAGAVPLLLTYGGHLVDDSGAPAGATTLTFSLYQGQADPAPIWSESVAVAPSAADGYFSVVLGMGTALPPDLGAHWLGITYPGEPEMPRVAITSTPWSLVAGSAESARSLDCTGCVGSAHLAPGAVGAANLASGAVGAASLAPPSPCAAGQVLTWSGTAWACGAPAPQSIVCTPESAPAGPAGILGGTAVATVTCPAPYLATAGGYASAAPGADVTVESHPASPSQWSFFIKNNDALRSWTGTVYAQCCRTQ